MLDRLLADPAGVLVVSDVDGTLASITDLSGDARIDAAALSALGRVASRVGRVVLLTGRPAEVVLGMGEVASVQGLRILGHYGMDSWYAGVASSPPAHPGIREARDALPELPPGVYVEDKGLSFVVHTRVADDPDAALAGLEAPLRSLAADRGLEVIGGSYVWEVRPPGIDKGTALREVVGAATSVVYLGDDDGDVPAARVLHALRQAGVDTWVVCAARPGGSAELQSMADEVVDGVAGVARWLDRLAGRLGAAG